MSEEKLVEAQEKLSGTISKLAALESDISEFSNASVALSENHAKNIDLANQLKEAIEALKDALSYFEEAGIKELTETIEDSFDAIEDKINDLAEVIQNANSNSEEYAKTSLGILIKNSWLSILQICLFGFMIYLLYT